MQTTSHALAVDNRLFPACGSSAEPQACRATTGISTYVCSLQI